jgi:hypothetical protein
MQQNAAYKVGIGFFFILLGLISCSEIISEEDISNKTVSLVAPTQNAQLTSTGINFYWDNVENATKYNLQIAKPNFTSPLQIVLDTTITQHNFTKQLPIGSYEWRVKALNGGYSTAYSSSLFTILNNIDFQSNTVALTSPANNLVTKTTLQNLTWQAIIGATNYQLQLYNSANTLVLDKTTSNTSENYTFAEGSYQWKVRATNGTDFTLYTSRSILVDATAPNTPTLTNPTNGNNTVTTNVTFSWTRTPITGSVEKDSIYIYTNAALTTLQSKAEANSPYSKTLSTGTYYWRVKSFDAAGNVGTASSSFNFTIN